jgi:hypothetical protein
MKDPNKKLNFQSFWGVEGMIKDYTVTKQAPEVIDQLQQSLDACTARIYRTRDPAVANEIIASLQVSINLNIY